MSASRSGSTALYEVLTNSNELLAIGGEHTPYYKIYGYSFPLLRSDLIELKQPGCDQKIMDLSQALMSQIRAKTDFRHFDLEDFFHTLTVRLSMQWPQLLLPYEEWLRHIRKAYKLYILKYRIWKTKLFFIEILKCLREEYQSINPFYYDISERILKKHFPHCCYPKSPPNPYFCIEEPPFITLKPYRIPTLLEIKNKPILLKASVDAYRLPLIKKLFPEAELKIIHLTRNPAASINGLYDGWLDRGFFSHNLEGIAHLSIAGYSDTHNFGINWWNYDLPPNWESMTEQPLEYVCGFQWYSANAAILEELSKEDKSSILRVRFEDLISSSYKRWLTISKITKFLGIELDYSLRTIAKIMPVVMATAHPYPRRWVSRKDMIWPVVTQCPIIQLANSLEYFLEDEEKWL